MRTVFSLKPFKNPYLWAYAAAIVLHVLLMVLKKPLTQALFIAPASEVPVSPPMKFEFVDVPRIEDQDSPPQDTPLIAEQNQISRDQQTAPFQAGHLATVDGVSRAKEILDRARAHKRVVPAEGSKEQKEAEFNAADVDPTFSFADVLQKKSETAEKEREQAVLGEAMLSQPKVRLDNRQTRALERGGLQLSTYAWNFAPYLSYLKRHINNHIFPPRAFDLGLIDGTTRIKFRIWRNGRLEGPEIIDFEGNSMLRDTSIKAVELSAPFKALPPNFPDEYLDIVGTFEYLVTRFGRGRP